MRIMSAQSELCQLCQLCRGKVLVSSPILWLAKSTQLHNFCRFFIFQAQLKRPEMADSRSCMG